MSEITEIKINKLTVEQYISVIEQDNSVDLPTDKCEKVLEKFKYCTSSNKHRNPKAWKEGAWTSFIAILELFRYLRTNQYDPAMEISTLFVKYKEDPMVNPNPKQAPMGSTFYNAMYLFADEHIYENGKKQSNYPVFDWIKVECDEKENCDLLMEGLYKNSTIEAVLRQLWKHVRGDKKGYEDMALRGFDTDLSDMKQLEAELQALNEEFAALPRNLILSQCKKMYDAEVKQIVFTGAPGTGKTFTVKKFAQMLVRKAYLEQNRRATDEEINAHIQQVQFHASYDYSDFVEGLRPVTIQGQKEMSFVRMDGSFKAFCRKVLKNRDKMPYFFLIDEINRADLSRVFGELMFCLDETNRARGTAREAVESAGVATQYTNLPTYKIEDGEAVKIDKEEDDVYLEKFAIPENVYILATMNDIDRSVEAFDFALRRRFKWIEAMANTEIENGLLGMLGAEVDEEAIKALAKKVTEMNNVIVNKGAKLQLDSSYQIGHAYFKGFTGTQASLQEIWDTQIKMILKEYCRGKRETKPFIDACAKELGVENKETV